MWRRQTCAPPAKLLSAQRPRLVVGLVTATPRQLRHQEISDIGEAFRRKSKSEVEPVDPGLFDPGFDFVSDLVRRADEHRADAADADFIGHLPHGPNPSGSGSGLD